MNSIEIRLKNSTVKLIGTDIISVTYHDNVVLEISDIQESFDVYNELALGKKLKALSEFGRYTSASTEARKYGETIALIASAEAMVFDGLATRMLLRFFQIFRKQPHPFKIFQNKDDAIKWLNSMPLL